MDSFTVQIIRMRKYLIEEKATTKKVECIAEMLVCKNNLFAIIYLLLVRVKYAVGIIVSCFWFIVIYIMIKEFTLLTIYIINYYNCYSC